MKNERFPTLFHLGFWLVTRFIGWLILGCLGCVVMALVMVVWHSQQGFDVLDHLIRGDYHYIKKLTHNQTLWIDHWIDVIPKRLERHAIQLPVVGDRYQQALWLQLSPYSHAMLMGLHLLLIRLYMLVRWCPLFLIAGVIGFIDGLAQRSIRRMSAGRESAFIYHHVKSLIMLSLIGGMSMDLLLPVSTLHSEWIVIFSAILFGCATQMTAKSFKKYL